eukprot:TRINITY_DN63436_c0_g1_i1.p1 TRINITY_DN63436_c0_g1~~TRINITY_DN63436_c0_g1_i1.p1  ORF type:complete len:924 (+),score=151.11 TRINITY_DN63436_c0_g1_i1:168-2939(+)
MPLATEEQERLSELQEWAGDIFAKPGRARQQAKRQGEAVAALKGSGSSKASGLVWPSADQATATLALQLDAGPIRRCATHALHSTICETLSWSNATSIRATSGQRVAERLANAAVVSHAPTSAVRTLCAAARESVGLWSALRFCRLTGSLPFAATPKQLLEYGSGSGKLVKDFEKTEWDHWRKTPEQSETKEERPKQLSQNGNDGDDDDEVEIPTGVASLRPYQSAALNAVKVAAPNNCCVVLPCGAGKTRVGAAISSSFLDAGPGRCVVVLCLRREGVRQWGRELANNWGINALEVSNVSAGNLGEALRKARVILVTYHRLLSERRRATASEGEKRPCWEDDGIGEGGALDSAAGGAVASRFSAAEGGLLLADECHMVPAPRIGELLKGLLNSGPSRRLVGLTATLLREGGAGGSSTAPANDKTPWPLLGECVFRETFAQLAPEYLAPVRCVEVSVPVTGSWHKLFKHKPLAAAVCLSRGKWQVLEQLLAKHAQDSLLITVERCEQARLIATMFGIVPIDGSVPATQLKDYLERFRARKILALVATHVLDDSADFPELTVMIQMGGHFASRRQEQQRLGRLLRWGPVKRQRWEACGARPTFYVLVHKNTVEERMSRHRTRSVLGVEYEKVAAADFVRGAESPLAGAGHLFPAADASSCVKTGTGEDEKTPDVAFGELAAHQVAAAERREQQCFQLSKRIVQTLPQRLARSKQSESKNAQLSDIRRWLQGSTLQEDEDEDSDRHFWHSSDSDNASETEQATARGVKRRTEANASGTSSDGDSSSSSSSSSASCTSLSTDSSKQTKAQAPKKRAAKLPKREKSGENKSKGRGRGRGRGVKRKDDSTAALTTRDAQGSGAEEHVAASTPVASATPPSDVANATSPTSTGPSLGTLAPGDAGAPRVFSRLQRQDAGKAPLAIDLDD